MKTLVFSLLISSSVLYAQDSQVFQTLYTCKQGSKERTVEVVYENKDGKAPCDVKYTKDGEAKSLWSARVDTKYCEDKAKEFVEKLKSLGLECQ